MIESTASMSIIMTVVVLHMHHLGPHVKPIPPRLRSLLFGAVARGLRMTTVAQYVSEQESRWERESQRKEHLIFSLSHRLVSPPGRGALNPD